MRKVRREMKARVSVTVRRGRRRWRWWTWYMGGEDGGGRDGMVVNKREMEGRFS